MKSQHISVITEKLRKYWKETSVNEFGLSFEEMLAFVTLFFCFLSSIDGFDLNLAKNLFGNSYKALESRIEKIQEEVKANFAPTLWCGIRNVAPFPEALSAIYPHLDSCCRSHDQVK